MAFGNELWRFGPWSSSSLMGNASSKAARKLPTRPSPTWAGARTPVHEPPPPSAQANRASELRTPDIEQDARDPDFLANLHKLGPVKVDHGPGSQISKQTMDPQASHINRLFQSRLASEEEASSLKPSKNRLFASSLHDLLNERKAAQTRQDLDKLARKYDVDVDKMERLARFLSTPSVDQALSVKNVDKNGEETLTFPALWVNPKIR
ncbi:hypothetical protein CC1G_03808 [Coprinopsis cinerea okayama7|uniref:Uncharacterized protein n=1 Tax=Coprinopsis cinerea (strain Okayama-7 / 130 / ATCC MYA-4618 / FGSC 9003) TaxID=240176 RepID=A8NGT1_COPC7|nr:hypothetical protein CC1G_03808 [Coprinopsis cinerea okayama7\|eukprot:XP_001833591.2 hypothetical protein CC1G_03808 [Coprinopsis cinerea okayama7\